MTPFPAFQFYPNDWLSSPKVAMMTAAEEGAYLRLLCYCWMDENCCLPDDDTQLSALSRLGEGWFKGSSTLLRKCFIPHPNFIGKITNKKLLVEREKCLAWRRKCIKGGNSSVKSKREQELQIASKVELKLKGSSRVVELEFNTSPSPSPSPSPPLNPPVAGAPGPPSRPMILNQKWEDEEVKPEKVSPKELMAEAVEEEMKNVDDRFEKLWAAYPKKRSQDDARKEWKKIRNQPDILEKIKHALLWQGRSEEWTKEGRKYVPNLAKYLKEKRWEEEEYADTPDSGQEDLIAEEGFRAREERRLLVEKYRKERESGGSN